MEIKMPRFSARIKELRKEKGLTQVQMAEFIGCKDRHYQKIEYAYLNGSFEVWDALEDLLGVHQRILRENTGTHPSPKENR